MLIVDRRDFLKLSGAAGAGLMIPPDLERTLERTLDGRAATSAAATVKLTPFLDAMPVPSVLTPVATPNGVPQYEVALTQTTQVAHSQLAATPTPVWGYNGAWPGPTIVAEVGKPISVRYRNLLPTTHLFAAQIDHTLTGAETTNPDVRIVTHLHGGHVPWTSDGHMDGWYVPEGYVPPAPQPATGPMYSPSVGNNYYYPNNQAPDTLWYHDHAAGITRLNVLAGLAGFYLLKDFALEGPAGLNLPSGNYEIGLAIQDRMFNPNGTLFYPPPPAPPEFFGDVIAVNGKVWPFLAVEPRKYRFRVLNGCNSRFLRMQLVTATPGGTGAIPNNPKSFVPGPVFNVLGGDGGFLPATAQQPVILIGPGERIDLIVDFTGLAGQEFQLYNDAATPFSGTPDTHGAVPQVMLFRVIKPLAGPDTSSIPTTIVPRRTLPAPTRTRWITLTEYVIKNGVISKLLQQRLDTLLLRDPATETPPLNATEVWEMINTTVDTHPLHLHHSAFQVMNRQAFASANYLTALGTGLPIDPTPFLIGPTIAADSHETGFKDTVRVNPGTITRILVNFPDYQGYYLHHCHILEHEEHEMIRPLIVGNPGPIV